MKFDREAWLAALLTGTDDTGRGAQVLEAAGLVDEDIYTDMATLMQMIDDDLALLDGDPFPDGPTG